jgi:hypothetical protein
VHVLPRDRLAPSAWAAPVHKKRDDVDELLRELETINALAAVRADYTKTLALLRALKAGAVALDQVRMTSDGWQVGEQDQPQLAVVVEPPEPGNDEPA